MVESMFLGDEVSADEHPLPDDLEAWAPEDRQEELKSILKGIYNDTGRTTELRQLPLLRG